MPEPRGDRLEPGPAVVRHGSPDGSLEPARGGGGLVSGLAPLVDGGDATWVAAAITDGDREAAAAGAVEADGFRVRPAGHRPATYRAAPTTSCRNETLWFLHHGLWDLSREPSFDRRWATAWARLPGR